MRGQAKLQSALNSMSPPESEPAGQCFLLSEDIKLDRLVEDDVGVGQRCKERFGEFCESVHEMMHRYTENETEAMCTG